MRRIAQLAGSRSDEPRLELVPIGPCPPPRPLDILATGAGGLQGGESSIALGDPVEESGKFGAQVRKAARYGVTVAPDALDNALQVVEEEALEPGPLLAVEVAAGQDRSDIGVEVRDRGRELMELAENGGDRTGQGLGLLLGVEAGQPLGNKRQELPRHFTGSSGHSEKGRHLAVQPGTERRNGVPSRLALVLGDGR